MQIKLYFAKQKTGSCCFMQINVSPHHVNLSFFFLNWLTFTSYWIPGLHCFAALHIGKSKTWEKTTETAFRKCSSNRCSMKLSKTHRKITVPEPHLNIVAGLQPASFLRKRPWHRCFPFTPLNSFKFSGPRKFSWPFNHNLWKKAILGHDTSFKLVEQYLTRKICSFMCVCVYVHPLSIKIHFFPLPSPFIATLVWSTKPF